MSDVDALLTADLNPWLARVMGIPPPPQALPSPSVELVHAPLPPAPLGFFTRLFQRDAGAAAATAAPTAAPPLLPLYPPAAIPTPLPIQTAVPSPFDLIEQTGVEPLPTAQEFSRLMGGPTQLDAWLPTDVKVSDMYLLLACYKPLEWTRIIGLTSEMLRVRHINPRTLDQSVAGWKLQEVAMAFFSRK